MGKRITLVTSIDEKELMKVYNLMRKINEKTCKVPYGTVENEKRYEVDNLPYHFTIFATNKENENKVIELIKKIDIEKIKLEVNQLKIAKGGRNNSWILYLGIKDNEDMKRLQHLFYKEFPNERFKNIFYKDATDEKYNPDNSIFHMTLHIDENYERVQYIYEKLKEDFKPFSLEFSKLVLFDYPGEKIKEFELKNKKDI